MNTNAPLPQQQNNDYTHHNPNIIQRNEQLINYALNYASRVLLIRFDVHYPQGYNAPEDNSLFQLFIEDYRRYLANKGYRPLYLWCRERNESPNFHYHVYFLLDYSKIRYMPTVIKAESIWCRKLGIPFQRGFIEYCNKESIIIKRNDQYSKDNALFIMSYLAKNITKEPIANIRNWNSSQRR